MSGVKITFTVNGRASSLPPGAYGPGAPVHERVKRSGQHDHSREADYSSAGRLLVRRIKSRLATRGACWTAVEDPHQRLIPIWFLALSDDRKRAHVRFLCDPVQSRYAWKSGNHRASQSGAVNVEVVR